MLARVAPCILIALSAVAGIVCLLCRDWWRGVYWLSAAMLNTAVTFGLK